MSSLLAGVGQLSQLAKLWFEVPVEDLRNASELVVRALLVRKKYMNMSSQQFPSATQRFLHQMYNAGPTATSSPATVDTPYHTGPYCAHGSHASLPKTP